AGDELSQLIDKGSKTDSTKNRRDEANILPHHRECEDERRKHQQPTPEHVGDVESPTTDLRVAGRREEGPDRKDGGYGRPQEALKITAGLKAPHDPGLCRNE